MKLILIFLSSILLSCNSMLNTQNQEVELQINTWILEYAIKENAEKWIPKNKNAFILTFQKQNRFSSRTDCNTIGGSYNLSENSLIFEQLMATEMWCENSEERIYGSLLTQINTYKLLNNNTLELYSKNNASKMVFKKQ